MVVVNEKTSRVTVRFPSDKVNTFKNTADRDRAGGSFGVAAVGLSAVKNRYGVIVSLPFMHACVWLAASETVGAAKILEGTRPVFPTSSGATNGKCSRRQFA